MTHPLAVDLNAILDRGEYLLRRLKAERIFITGGTGFFGRWLLEALTWADDRLNLDLRITVLSRNPDVFARTAPILTQHRALSWCRGDVLNFSPPPGRFPFIIHGATAASEWLNRSQPLLMLDTIIVGTRRVLDFARDSGCEALLLTSSGAIYGHQPADVLHMDEGYAGAPDPNTSSSAYGEGKRAAECLCAASGVPVKIARGFAFVGPFLPLDTHFAVGNFIRDALRGQTIKVQGDGTPYRSYLYAADLVVWLLKILLDGQPHRPYNVGSDKEISIADLARVVADQVPGTEVRVRGSASGASAQRYVPSIARARTELDLDVWTPLDQALRNTLQWAGVTAP